MAAPLLPRMKQLFKPILFVIAAAYIAVDALFDLMARPIADWLSRQRIFARLRARVAALPRYAALAAFAVPLILLEPVKPVAAYLAASGHFVSGATMFVCGELLKLVLVERLFHINRDKLLSIPAFAWCYRIYRSIIAWVTSFEVWRTTVRRVTALGAALREAAVQLFALPRPPRASTQRIDRRRRA